MRCVNCNMQPAADGSPRCIPCGLRSSREVAHREQARAADMDLRVTLSVLAERTAELEALKARRCDGCVLWSRVTPSYGQCTAPALSGRVDITGGDALWTDIDHACNEWAPLP